MSSSPAAGSYVVFTVAGTTYALRSEDVRHMEMIEGITPVPNAIECLDGVVFSRGQIVPVLNLRARFGFERVPFDLKTRLLIVAAGDRWVGLVADSAREFVRIPDAAIQPPSSAITSLSASYLDGVASLEGRLVLVLNVANVVNTLPGADDETGGPEGFTGGAADNDGTRV